MPWWVIVYLIVLVALSAGGVADDARDAKPGWWLGLAVVSLSSSAVLVLAYWGVLPASIPGFALAGLLAFAVLFDGWSAASDLRADARDSALAPRENALIRVVGVCLSVALLAPAYAFGVLAVLRA